MSNGFKHIVKTSIVFIILTNSLYSQGKDVGRELKRLNAKIDRVRVLVDSLELDNQILLPELMSAFRQAVKSKAQQDSITLVVLKRLNTLSNKIVENSIEFGSTQSPFIDDYADKINTIDFLLKLS